MVDWFREMLMAAIISAAIQRRSTGGESSTGLRRGGTRPMEAAFGR
jgi:hypothetical protein